MAARTTSLTAANVETHARYERRALMRKPAIRMWKRVRPLTTPLIPYFGLPGRYCRLLQAPSKR
jgi:hypothetical protein